MPSRALANAYSILTKFGFRSGELYSVAWLLQSSHWQTLSAFAHPNWHTYNRAASRSENPTFSKRRRNGSTGNRIWTE